MYWKGDCGRRRRSVEGGDESTESAVKGGKAREQKKSQWESDIQSEGEREGYTK